MSILWWDHGETFGASCSCMGASSPRGDVTTHGLMNRHLFIFFFNAHSMLSTMSMYTEQTDVSVYGCHHFGGD